MFTYVCILVSEKVDDLVTATGMYVNYCCNNS